MKVFYYPVISDGNCEEIIKCQLDPNYDNDTDDM